MVVANKNNLTFDMLLQLYKKYNRWPRVDRVQRRIVIRGLVRGFVSLTMEEKVAASALSQRFVDVTIATSAYLIHCDMAHGVVDVWGPDQQTVSRAMLAILRLVRKRT